MLTSSGLLYRRWPRHAALRLGASLVAALCLGALGMAGCSDSEGPSGDAAPVVDGGLDQPRPAEAGPGSEAGIDLGGGPPANDPTVATTLFGSTSFLYTGPNPRQTGVAAGTILPRAVAVIRGRVLGRDSKALPGVEVTVLGHSEYGATRTDAEGAFALALNGGATYTIDLRLAGYLPAQRKAQAAWQEWTSLGDVTLIALDTKVTALTVGAATMQVAQGSPVKDEAGERTATLLVPPQTTASMVLPDGTTRSLSSLKIRATEYTVGADGPAAMPGELPPSSGYTYAVELSDDDALAAGATTVTFSKPLVQYVENFLGLPVGGAVPAGVYDRRRGAWVPIDDGRVIGGLSVSGGKATLDLDGSGQSADAAALTALGIEEEELTKLAGLYQAGQSLWRVRVPHFSPFDFNWPWGLPVDALGPDLDLPDLDKLQSNPCRLRGRSSIECLNQTLGETLPLSGTPHALHYQSDRVLGHLTDDVIEIPLTGSAMPGSLKRVELEVHLAGQVYRKSFTPQAGARHTFTWDRKDALGRTVQGAQAGRVRVGYVYDAVAYMPGESVSRSFGSPGLVPTQIKMRQEMRLWQEQRIVVGKLEARSAGLGGWTVSVHHRYDPAARLLHLGDGRRRSAQDVAPRVIRSLTSEALPGHPSAVAVDARGSLFLAANSSSGAFTSFKVVQVGADGKLLELFSQTDAQIYGLALDARGDLIYSTSEHKIRKYELQSKQVSVLAGGPSGPGCDGEEVEALKACIFPDGLAVDPQGNIFFADSQNNKGRIRKLGVEGLIRTVAGTGVNSCTGTGVPAIQATLNGPTDVALDSQGNLYIADTYCNLVRRVGPDGIISTVAGGKPGASAGSGDGGPALDAALSYPHAVRVDGAGSVILADATNRLRLVDPAGMISAFAGSGAAAVDVPDGVPATAAKLYAIRKIAVDGSGEVTFGMDAASGRLLRVSSALPGFDGTDLAIPSEDGSALYRFSSAGRHLSTVSTLTGATLLTFAYDAAGRLVGITDGDGNTTSIKRGAAGEPTAVVGPFGQSTTLGLDTNGYLAGVTPPAGGATSFTYAADGLLLSQTDPNGHVSSYSYDPLGRLTRDQDPLGAAVALDRTALADGRRVASTSAEGRITGHELHLLPGELETYQKTFPDGTKKSVASGGDGSLRVTYADGQVRTQRSGPDPRFLLAAPVETAVELASPAGVKWSASFARTATLKDPLDPLSLVTQTDTRTVNGRTYTFELDAGKKQLTLTSPAGRKLVLVFDEQGRLVGSTMPGRAPLEMTYDNRGRVVKVVEGSGAAARTTSVTYDGGGYPSSVTDALARVTGYTHDAAGRLTGISLPGARQVALTLDPGGNVVAVTPPGGGAHAFSYDKAGNLVRYEPPAAGTSGTATAYAFDKDRLLQQVDRADGVTVKVTRDAAGRVSSVVGPEGTLSASYSDTTGQLVTLTSADGVTLSRTLDGSLLTKESWSGPVQGEVSRTLAAGFRVAEERVNGANAATFAYQDQDGLLSAAGSLSLSRDPASGQVTGSSLGGVTTSQSRDGFGALVSVTASHGGKALYSATYTRDALNRITALTETVDGVTSSFGYSYDAAGRLVQVLQGGAAAYGYGYDGNSNRTSLTVGTGPKVTATFDAQDRLLGQGDASYAHNAAGERTGKTQAGKTTSCVYDAAGNLRQVTLSDGKAVRYLLDGEGRRVGRQLDGVLTAGYLYGDRLGPAAVLDGAGKLVSRFVYATREHVPDYMVREGKTYRLITDHLGSVRLVVDAASGAVAQRIDYGPFGEVLQDTSPGFQPFGYAGGLYDPQTGLVLFGARSYDPETGRFTGRDPLGFASGSWNLYAYAGGDPVNLIDSDGLRERSPNEKEMLDIAMGLKRDYAPPWQRAQKSARLQQRIQHLRWVRDLNKELLPDSDGLVMTPDFMTPFLDAQIAMELARYHRLNPCVSRTQLIEHLQNWVNMPGQLSTGPVVLPGRL